MVYKLDLYKIIILNNMEDIDLNIENYNLNDLLKLFNLNYNYDLLDLKRAKRIL